MEQNNIPLDGFLSSVLLGMALWIFHPNGHRMSSYTLALGSCAAAWCLLPALASRARWRGTEVVALLMAIFGAVMVIRPMIITEIMAQLPLLRSLRWPFREFIQFQFFFHLFLLVRPPRFHARGAQVLRGIRHIRLRRADAVLSLRADVQHDDVGPRTDHQRARDKDYWAHVGRYLQPGDRIAVIIPLELYTDDRFEEPYSLLGTFNYASSEGIINVWVTRRRRRSTAILPVTAFYPFGALPSRSPAAALEADPRRQDHHAGKPDAAADHAQLERWADG